jgi:hypothetical protein
MANARRRASGLKCAALLGLGALALHQLRYLLANGSSTSEALASQGHGYLGLVLPGVASLAIALLGALLLIAAVERPAAEASRKRKGGHPAGFALVLLAGFCAQELLEGALAPGHPSGLGGLLANQGWIAIPLAALIGGLVALALRGFGTLERRFAGTLARPRLRTPRSAHLLYKEPDAVEPARFALLLGLACRAPPSLDARS